MLPLDDLPGPQGPDPQGGEGLPDLRLGEVPGQVGQLVEPRQQPLGGAAANQEAVPAAHGEHGQAFLPLRPLLPPVGIVPLGPVGISPAEGGQRAIAAQGRFRQADQGPKIHKRLVQVPGSIAHPIPQKAGPPVPDSLVGHVPPVLVEPGHDPQHVPVHGGFLLPEGDGRDGPGGVGADAGELHELRRGPGEQAPIIFPHRLAALLQIPGPGVIPEALPQLQQPFLVAGGQGKNRREFPHEPAVVGDHRRRPGLLEHDLRHQDGIGVPRPPPGQGALVGVIPFDQGVRKFHESSIPYPRRMCYTGAIIKEEGRRYGF